jgi:hypothetical protein
MTTIPLSFTVQSLAKAMLAKAGLRSIFHLQIAISMGALETVQHTPTDHAFGVDRSASTLNLIPGGSETILDTAKDACQQFLANLGPEDRVAVVPFDDRADIALDLTPCDDSGKARISQVIWNIVPPQRGHSTSFAAGLEKIRQVFAKPAEGRKQQADFFTDGANAAGPDPVAICKQIRDSGIMLRVGGLGVNNSGEKLLEQMAGSDFKPLSTAAEVVAFFEAAQVAAASAAVVNSQLRVTPVNFVTLRNFELVTRLDPVLQQHKQGYLPCDPATNLLTLGSLGTGDQLHCYLGMQLELPADIKPGRRSFGKIELIGDVPSDGRKGAVLAATPIAVTFSETAVPGMNDEVKDMINVAGGLREMYQYAQTGDPDHLANARKTVAFSNSAVAAALAAQIDQINTAAAKDPEAAAKQARRATKGFSAAEAAAALARLKK